MLLALAVALTVDGAVASPLRLDAAALAAMPPAKASWIVHGAPLSCTGAWLIDVLAAAGVEAGDAVKGAALTRAVVAAAADGYRVAFTLGELDRKLGNVPVLVASRCNGEPLTDTEGPLRLLVAGEARGARSVRQLERLTVVDIAAP